MLLTDCMYQPQLAFLSDYHVVLCLHFSSLDKDAYIILKFISSV